MTISNTSRSTWTQEMDAQVKNAVSEYNRDHETPFSDIPFRSKSSFSELKQRYLQDLDKDSKQIRERWRCHLSPKIRAVSVLKEDREVMKSFCNANPREWAKVSRMTYEYFNKKTLLF